MKLTLPDYRHADVLVVGDIMLDRYWYGATGRISPEAPVQVINVDRESTVLGGAGNVVVIEEYLSGLLKALQINKCLDPKTYRFVLFCFEYFRKS